MSVRGGDVRARSRTSGGVACVGWLAVDTPDADSASHAVVNWIALSGSYENFRGSMKNYPGAMKIIREL